MARTVALSGTRSKSAAAARSKPTLQRHDYFKIVAQARYIWRKVYRLIEEQAKLHQLDSLQHQALLQVYGSPNEALRVRELADRLDIAPAFASNLVKALIERELLLRGSDPTDLRATLLRISESGKKLCNKIDDDVRPHVNYFTSQLSADEQRMARSILMFYTTSF
jgi:DNA-binding MarR family transcriptional regulator